MSNKQEKVIRTLCHRCKQYYESAGYICISQWGQYKEPCDICGKSGFDYQIIRKGDCIAYK